MALDKGSSRARVFNCRAGKRGRGKEVYRGLRRTPAQRGEGAEGLRAAGGGGRSSPASSHDMRGIYAWTILLSRPLSLCLEVAICLDITTTAGKGCTKAQSRWRG